MTTPASSTPETEPLITTLAPPTPGPNRRKSSDLIQPDPDPLTAPSPPPDQEIVPPPRINTIINMINNAITNPAVFSFCAEIHPHPLSPPPLNIVVQSTPSLTDTNPGNPTPPSPPPPSPSPLLGSSHLQPRIHPYTNRKASNWHLPIRKETIIMGDSNLARIPKLKLNAIQLDSFPGATLRHITTILQKIASPRP
ncbi:unnamed protein product [Arctogadus glacialis]